MRYRGFNITNCVDHGIERYDFDKREMKTYDGYYCEIYPGNDDLYANRLDYFCLAAGREIPDMSDQALEDAICKYVDDNISSLKEGRADAVSNRNANLLGRAVCLIGELQSGEELYNTLTDQIGMSDDEIRMIGFKSLVPYFNRDYYAQTIAEYMTDEGSESTSSGNYHFPFGEINERFGTELPSDKEMLDKIVSSFDPDIVADIDITEDFDLMFCLAYCPNAEEDETLTPQM